MRKSDLQESVRRQFGRRASAYAQSRSHASGDDLRRLVELLPQGKSLEALDVATGTGHTALALAAHVGSVIGLDLTPEMLREAEALAAQRGVQNVRFLTGDAAALPFPDHRFQIVTCRRAPHHFPDVGRFLAEVGRVLEPGGVFGLVDQTSPEAAAAQDLIESFEKLRDPTHVHALTPKEWRQALHDAGLHVRHLEITTEERYVDEYLDVAGVEPAVRQAIYALIEAAPRAAVEMNGFTRRDGRLMFDRRRVLAIAVA